MNNPSLLHRRLLSWYRRHARDFSWRRTRDPYVILLAEIMLQQTQADRVEEKLPLFLKRFPTIASLARARRSSVIKAWRGMGYNRRAVHVHAAARMVVRQYGTLPRDRDALLALPGIGEYTASAVMCFAYTMRVPVVDVNIRRVLSRLSKRRKAFDDLLDDRAAWNLAGKWLPQKYFYEWNQALMDIGARFCKARSVACAECPLQKHCPSAVTLSAASFRALHTKKAPTREPSRNGVPNRLWRGKIIESLRSKSFHNAHALGKHVDAAFDKSDLVWLNTLLARLERDGLVRVRRSAGGKIYLA